MGREERQNLMIGGGSRKWKMEGKGRGRSRSGVERGIPSISLLTAFSVSRYFYLADH